MSKGRSVDKKHLLQVLKWLRDFRERAIKKSIDPWAVRQGLVLVLHVDTRTALESGVPIEALKDFDRQVVKNAEKLEPFEDPLGSRVLH